MTGHGGHGGNRCTVELAHEPVEHLDGLAALEVVVGGQGPDVETGAEAGVGAGEHDSASFAVHGRGASSTTAIATLPSSATTPTSRRPDIAGVATNRLFRQQDWMSTNAESSRTDFDLRNGARSFASTWTARTRPRRSSRHRTSFSIGWAQALHVGLQRVDAQVGFDEIELGDVVTPAITTVPQQPLDLGRRAAETLFDRIGGSTGPPTKEIIASALIERGTGEIGRVGLGWCIDDTDREPESRRLQQLHHLLVGVLPRTTVVPMEIDGTYGVPPTTDILINATSVGLYPNVDERLPIDLDHVSFSTVVADVVFNPPRTRLLQDAQAHGCVTIDRLEMPIG